MTAYMEKPTLADSIIKLVIEPNESPKKQIRLSPATYLAMLEQIKKNNVVLQRLYNQGKVVQNKQG